MVAVNVLFLYCKYPISNLNFRAKIPTSGIRLPDHIYFHNQHTHTEFLKQVAEWSNLRNWFWRKSLYYNRVLAIWIFAPKSPLRYIAKPLINLLSHVWVYTIQKCMWAGRRSSARVIFGAKIQNSNRSNSDLNFRAKIELKGYRRRGHLSQKSGMGM